MYTIGMFETFLHDQRRAAGTVEEEEGWLLLIAWVDRRTARLKSRYGGIVNIRDLPLFYLFDDEDC